MPLGAQVTGGAARGTGKFPGRNKVPQKETGFSSTLVLKFIGPLKGIPLKMLFNALDGTWEVSGVTGKKEAQTCFLHGTRSLARVVQALGQGCLAGCWWWGRQWWGQRLPYRRQSETAAEPGTERSKPAGWSRC